MPHVKAAILAGGLGGRLKPLTDHRPKPTVPIEKRRLIDFPISNCLNSDEVGSVEVLAQTHVNKLLDYIVATYLIHEVKKPVRCRVPPIIVASNDEFFKGTADAVRQTKTLFMGSHEHLLVLAGDHLYVMNYDSLIGHHSETGAAITVVVQKVPVSEAAKQFGVFTVAENGQPLSFDEKPENPNAVGGTNLCLASLGIYIFRVDKLQELLAKCPGNDFGHDIIPYALRRAAKYPISLFEFNGYWRDVGTIRSLWQANMDLVGPSPAINLYDFNNPIYHMPRHLPSPKFINGSQTQDSIISDGSIVAGEINSSVISTRVRVGSNSRIVRSVIFDGVQIGAGVSLTNTVVDKYSVIDDGVVLGQDIDQEAKDYPDIQVRDGIIIVPRNTTINKKIAP